MLIVDCIFGPGHSMHGFLLWWLCFFSFLGGRRLVQVQLKLGLLRSRCLSSCGSGFCHYGSIQNIIWKSGSPHNSMLFLIALVISAHCKIFEGMMTVPALKQQSMWFYLGRQTFSPGNSTVSLETNLEGVPYSQFEDIQFVVIEGSQWEKHPSKCLCSPSRSYRHPIRFNGNTTSTEMTLEQTSPKLYYFIIRDCNSSLVLQKDNYGMHIKYKLTIVNNSSYLGHYQNDLIIFLSFISTVAMCYKVKRDGKKTEETDWIQIGFLAGLVTRALALLCKMTVFLYGWKYGTFSYLIEVMYLLFSALSQSMVTSVLVFIAFGWTIIFIKLEQYQKYIPLITIFSFSNIILSVLGILNQSVHDKYHMFDSIPGLLQIIMKLIMVWIFCYGIYRSLKKANQTQQLFILGFASGGIIYILSIPLTYFICQYLISPAEQQHYGLIIHELFNLVFNVIFTQNLVVPNSFYRQNRKRHTFLPVDQKFY